MSRPFQSRFGASSPPTTRINGKIRAREVRVIGNDGAQLGVLSLHEAINLARAAGVDLVEVAPNANPPVCRIVDFGKFRYEQSKRDKESKKHQQGSRLKFGLQVVRRYIQELAPWGQVAAEPKLQGRNVSVMINPLPRSKRAPNPKESDAGAPGGKPPGKEVSAPLRQVDVTAVAQSTARPRSPSEVESGFVSSPFSSLSVPHGESGS